MDINALLKKVGEDAPMPSCGARKHNRYITSHMDGDYAAYFCAGSDNCGAGEARRNVLSRVSKLRTISGAGQVVMHLTHGASSKGDRFLVAQARPYQGQRTHGSKPKQWQFLREWMESYDGPEFKVALWKDREADDGMAHACHTAASLRNVLHVVHTADKDMRMFCGTHVAWNSYAITDVPLGAYDVIGADHKQYGHKWFWMQMLQGDTADHIPGLPKVGEKGAEELLAGTTCNDEARELVIGKYIDKMGWDKWADFFVEQAVLLWMRTDYHSSIRNVLPILGDGPQVLEAMMRMEDRVRLARHNLRRLQCD